jgi:hypothetical protein
MNFKFSVRTHSLGAERIQPGHCTCGRDPFPNRLKLPRMARTRREAVVQFLRDNPSLHRGDPEMEADRLLGRR